MAGIVCPVSEIGCSCPPVRSTKRLTSDHSLSPSGCVRVVSSVQSTLQQSQLSLNGQSGRNLPAPRRSTIAQIDGAQLGRQHAHVGLSPSDDQPSAWDERRGRGEPRRRMRSMSRDDYDGWSVAGLQLTNDTAAPLIWLLPLRAPPPHAFSGAVIGIRILVLRLIRVRMVPPATKRESLCKRRCAPQRESKQRPQSEHLGRVSE
jgi:hypothetical protein